MSRQKTPEELAWLEHVAAEPTDGEMAWRRLAFDEAVRLTREGYPVIPLWPGTKIPVLGKWERLKASMEAVATWFEPYGGEYAGYNIGVVTGPDSDLWVLDVDTGHGPAAAASFGRLLKARGGKFMETRVATTASGGKHFWYRWPQAVPDVETGEVPRWKSSAGSPKPNKTEADTAFGYGIDVKAESSQIVVYPSRLGTPEEPRQYGRADGDVALIPGWMAERTRWREPVLGGVSVVASQLTARVRVRADEWSKTAVETVLSRLDAMREAAVPGWTRIDSGGYRGEYWDPGCIAVAMRLLDFVVADWCDLDQESAYRAFFDRAPRDDGFTDEDVTTKWRSASRSHPGKPATIPEWILLDTVRGRMFEERQEYDEDHNPLGVPVDPDTGEVLDLTGELSEEEEAEVRKEVQEALDVRDEKGKPQLLNGTTRVLQDHDVARGLDNHFWRYESGVWVRDSDVISREGAKLYGNDWQHRYAPTMVDHALGRVPRLRDDVIPSLMNVRNGMLDWRTEELLPHRPDYHSRVQYPVAWDNTADCPRFDAWVSQVAPDGLDVRVWEVIAYMLLPGNELQRAVLLYGDGENGKGTLIRVLQRLLGAWNCSSVTLKRMTTGRFDVAQLYGKAANLAGDIDAAHLQDTAMFKALTGQDTVTGEQKHRDGFDFINHATPLFSANELFRSSDNSHGYLRRWLVVPMHVKVKELGITLNEDDLLSELPGILAKAVTYLRPMMARKEAGEPPFTETVQTLIAQDQFAQASDLVRIWLADDDVIASHEPGSKDGDTAVSRDALHRRFKTWCQDSGLGVLGVRKFYARIEALGYTSTRRDNKRVFLGFRMDTDRFGNTVFL